MVRVLRIEFCYFCLVGVLECWERAAFCLVMGLFFAGLLWVCCVHAWRVFCQRFCAFFNDISVPSNTYPSFAWSPLKITLHFMPPPKSQINSHKILRIGPSLTHSHLIHAPSDLPSLTFQATINPKIRTTSNSIKLLHSVCCLVVDSVNFGR